MTTIHELEIIDESILDDEIKCEATHKYVKECGPVAYRVNGCVGPKNFCAPVVEHPTDGTLAAMNWATCIFCHRPARDCWSVHPI